MLLLLLLLLLWQHPVVVVLKGAVVQVGKSVVELVEQVDISDKSRIDQTIWRLRRRMRMRRRRVVGDWIRDGILEVLAGIVVVRICW